MQATLARTEEIVPGLALPSHLARRVWRGGAWRGGAERTVPTGHALLDAELPGGGWPLGGVTELLLERNGIGEIRLLADVLRRLSTVESGAHPEIDPNARHIALVGPPFQPYAPALASWGIAPERVLWVKAEPRQALWAAQQVLRQAAVGVLLLWLPQAGDDALRRLQVLALEGRTLTFLLRPAAAARQPSPAPLRIRCRVAPSCPASCLETSDQHTSCLQLEILKRRGPLATTPLHLRLPLESRAGWPLSMTTGAQAEGFGASPGLIRDSTRDSTRDVIHGVTHQEACDAVDRRDIAGSAARSGKAAIAVSASASVSD